VGLLPLLKGGWEGFLDGTTISKFRIAWAIEKFRKEDEQ
jgi:hypothetical protein